MWAVTGLLVFVFLFLYFFLNKGWVPKMVWFWSSGGLG